MRSASRFTVAIVFAALLATIATNPASAAGKTPRAKQWALPYFQAQQVWEHGAGAGVTVAVVDGGVDAHHPDLVGQVEPGASFGSGSGESTIDQQGHGTGMASLIAGSGAGDAHQGIKGLAYQARILAVGVPTSDVQPSAYAQGITYAADHGAKVINVSGGGPSDSPELHHAIAYANTRDAVVVAAAGNEADEGNEPDYPAADAGVVAVAGTDQSDRPWAKSQFGRQVVLAAPATDQERASIAGGYGIGTGTSDSAAWVSATAAIVRGMHPGWTAGQTIRQLIATARKPGGRAGRDDHYGYGIVNPLAAVTTPLAAAETSNPLLPPRLTMPMPVVNSLPEETQPNLVRWIIGGALGALLLAGGALVAVLRRRRRPNAAGMNTSPGGWPPGWPTQPQPPRKPPTWPPGPRS